jgi:glycosyltransferase involved in cell wall biosynthesis
MAHNVLEPNNQRSGAADNRPLSLSVIICTYDPENYPNLKEALDSLLQQSHKVVEIIVVVDGEQVLAGQLSSVYSSHRNLRVIVTEKGLSITQARNVGIKAATGDIVAFTDDDVVVDKDWAAYLMDTYKKTDAYAVGGKILPIWLSGKPEHLPEELYWLVGVTHKGFAEEKVTEVRDAFGPNMSFKRQVFETVGGFNEKLGFARQKNSYVQGEEPELGLRMKNELGKGVIYNPKAIVYHKVPSSKLKLGVLVKRSFYQGYSKALINKIISSPDSLNTERSYLKNLFSKAMPGQMKKQTSVLLLCVLAVGFGFVYGRIKAR